jgi:uncharacterized protein YbjT (DUF2867 family)
MEVVVKIVVIGGSGLIGTKLVSRLRQKGHEVVAGSPNSGVNTIAASTHALGVRRVDWKGV